MKNGKQKPGCDIKYYKGRTDRMDDKEANLTVSSLSEKITKIEKILKSCPKFSPLFIFPHSPDMKL